MKAKLIKHEVDYYCLLNNKGEVIADVNGGDIDKLSLKNCQAIERGYDLDELADFYSTMTVFIKKDEVPTERQIEDAEYISEIAFKEGFQKALDLNNTKLFILEDMMNCWNKALKFQEHKETWGEYIQSLQQTEWDVEIEMEEIILPFGANQFINESKPKLDENRCLILKRI